MKKVPLAARGARPSMAVGEFKKIVTSRKSDYIVEQIYEALVRGDLKPNQHLSSESELAEAFGVSKLTVREAVRSLEQMGIIEVRKGGSGGLFVKEVDLASTVKKIGSILRIPHITVADLTETRIALETFIIKEMLPTRQITGKMLERLERNIDAAEQFFNSKKNLDRLRTNFEFHLIIASMTDNNMIIILHQLVCDMLLHFYELARPSSEMALRTLSYHRQILAAIRDQDFDEAAVVNARHMQETGKDIKEKSKQQSYL